MTTRFVNYQQAVPQPTIADELRIRCEHQVELTVTANKSLAKWEWVALLEQAIVDLEKSP